MSKVKPILFNTEMVRAILDGRKTVTRRVVKSKCKGGKILDEKSPYQPGDILYVRETWALQKRGYMYKANWEPFGMGDVVKWKPSIHMPKQASRIWLKVTDVRVERLQDITSANVAKEGVEDPCKDCDGAWDCSVCPAEGGIMEKWKELWNSTIKKSDLDRYGWDENPWVWVIEFERCEKPEGV